MLNMDMIAYRQAGDAFDLDFATNDTNPALTQFCRDATATYVPSLPTVTGVLTAGSSDHASYAATGVPSAFFFEDLDSDSPFIHTANDTLGNSANDFTLAREITKAFVAAAATLAGPVDMALAHAPLADTTDAGGPYDLAVTATSLTASPVGERDGLLHRRRRRRAVDGAHEVHDPEPLGRQPARRDGRGPDEGRPDLSPARHRRGRPPAVAARGLRAGEQVVSLHRREPRGRLRRRLRGPGRQRLGAHAGRDAGRLAARRAGGQSGDPSAAAQGVAVWANDLGAPGWNGAYGASVENWLESPAINTLGKTGLHLRFQRSLGVEDGLYDQASIALNGTTVWQNPATPGGTSNTIDTEWTPQDLDVSGLADNKASVKLRFKLKSDGGVQFGGWTIDDLKLASLQPGTVPRLVASVAHVSATAGGTVTLSIDAGPAFAGRTYLVAMSATGTAPGTPLGSIVVPLVFDTATQLGFGFINTPAFQSFAGPLSAQGKGTATFHSPPIVNASLPGLDLHFAAFTLGPIDWTSNAVTVQYEP
jgi:hypothetical protein